ncbi:SMI1/KNR4 family protein [Micromonospora endolithica]|uniref:SMI1/KNR4 family protein n=1 Tax=Micromonospora endolithica TaxID=230091 RepID=UPI0011AD9D3E|nr:SMI1/KNR4 family protein [Micromonospora endolithica]TWJ21253.1 SMI1/KNR4 family protein SUKH-1 [Micromonospora endolithica]
MIDASLSQADAWRPFVTALRNSMPPGAAEAEFRGTMAPGAFGGSIAYDGDHSLPGLRLERGERPTDMLRSLAGLTGGQTVAVRGVTTRSGSAVVSIVPSAPQVSFGMGSDLLEDVHLVAGAHPEPYRREPVRHDVALSAGADAATVTALVRQLLPDARPVDPSELAAAEADLGVALPDDVRALFLAAAEGTLVLQPADRELFYGLRIVPLADAAARAYLEPQARYLSWTYGATEVVAPDPHGRVQQLAASSAWFVVGEDGGGNLYVVDLAPGPQGTFGQVLFVDHEMSAGARWLAPSLTELLTERPATLAKPGPEGELLVRVGSRTGKTLADVQPTTEVLYIGAAAVPCDLSALAGHRLRTLVTESAVVANLPATTELPALEYLRLDVVGWQQLLRAGQVPSTLLTAGLSGRAGWTDTVEVVNGLLAAWKRKPIQVIDVPV